MVKRTPEEKAMIKLGKARRKRRNATAAYQKAKRTLVSALTKRETAVDNLCEDLELAHGETAAALEFLALYYRTIKDQARAQKVEEELDSLDRDYQEIGTETTRLLLSFVSDRVIKRPAAEGETRSNIEIDGTNTRFEQEQSGVHSINIIDIDEANTPLDEGAKPITDIDIDEARFDENGAESMTDIETDRVDMSGLSQR